MARGSWLLDRAMRQRWTDADLDSDFRAKAVDPTRTDYQPWNDQIAQPSPHHPYCVYDPGVPVVEARYSDPASSTKFGQQERRRVVFRIHAKDNSISGESGKAIAQDLVANVADAYDPSNAIEISTDCHIITQPAGDFWTLEDENDGSGFWTLQYDIVYEAFYTVG